MFEQRSQIFQKMFKFNPGKCSSASSFSGCVHRDKSKCCIALPTDAEHVRAFEKTLIGGFSCVNTRFAFDTEILMNDYNTENVLFDFWHRSKTITIWLPYGCIKKKYFPLSIAEFNKIIDTTGHLFAVDIKFHDINEKTLLFNELYQPIFLEKQKNKSL